MYGVRLRFHVFSERNWGLSGLGFGGVGLSVFRVWGFGRSRV